MVDQMVVENIIQRTFLWTWGVIAITFAVGYRMAWLIKEWVIDPWQFTMLFWISIIWGFWLVVAISWFWSKFSYTTLATLFVLFGVLEWVWISWALAVYASWAIINAFAWAAVLFLVMAVYGYTTKADLSKFGTLLMVWLIAVIIMAVINMFIGSSMLATIISIVWIIVFLWLTAYDMQMLKTMAQTWDNRIEIVFGLWLFLNFINIFLMLLQLMTGGED